MSQKIRTILLPTAVVLFILEVLTLPLVLGLTYASKSESPEHILTFSGKKLSWDSGTIVDSHGTASLELFEEYYNNTNAENNEDIVAPGTQGRSIVRLKNDDKNPISYTAVLYVIRSDQELPVEVELSGEDLEKTEEYPLPDGIAKDKIISAVSGEVESGKMQDFCIDWFWKYEESSMQDLTDTEFGDKAAEKIPDDLTVGIFITVEGDDGKIIVSSPKTGYNNVIGGYMILIGISAAMIIILTITKKKEEADE